MSTIDAACVSRPISSSVLIRRASRNTCCPSTTGTPAACSANSTSGSITSTPTGWPSRPKSRSTCDDLRRDVLGPVRTRTDRAAQRGDARTAAVVVAAPRRRVRLVQPRRLQRCGAWPPTRSPTAPDPRRAAGSRTGSSCPSPTCRCGSRSCTGCCGSRTSAPRPGSERSSSAFSFARRSCRSRPMSRRDSQSTWLVPYVGETITSPVISGARGRCPGQGKSGASESSGGRVRRYSAAWASRRSLS